MTGNNPPKTAAKSDNKRAQTRSRSPKKKTSAGRRRMQLWGVMVILFVSWALYTMYTQVGERKQAEQKVQDVQTQIDEAAQKMDELQVRLEQLNDPEYIANRATKELNLVRPTEVPIVAD